jgi:tRNA pseudouridine55 synthase
LYSAKKVDGKRLYEYAREGKQIKPKACNVRVDEVIVLDQAPDMLKLEISSSSGMYVRSLAHDLGQSIGCGAYLEDLVRVRVGPFKLEDSVTLEDIEKMASGNDLSFVTPVGNMLPHMQRVDINRAQLERVRNGNHVVVFNPTLTDGQQVRLFDSTGTMVALGEVQRPLGSMQLRVQPKVVLI